MQQNSFFFRYFPIGKVYKIIFQTFQSTIIILFKFNLRFLHPRKFIYILRENSRQIKASFNHYVSFINFCVYNIQYSHLKLAKIVASNSLYFKRNILRPVIYMPLIYAFFFFFFSLCTSMLANSLINFCYIIA